MSGRRKQPIEVLQAKGASHLTKAEIAKRKEGQIKACDNNIRAPSFLTAKQKREFDEVAGELVKLEIMGNLDCDLLGMYIATKDEWVQFGKDYKKAGSLDARGKVYSLRDKALKQCRAMASELGLSMTSRCKLVIPKKEEPKENKFAKFQVM